MRHAIAAGLVLGVVLVSSFWAEGGSAKGSAGTFAPASSLAATITVNNPILSTGTGLLAVVKVKNVSRSNVAVDGLFGWAPWSLKIASKSDSVAGYKLYVIGPDVRQAYKVKRLVPGKEFRLEYKALLQRLSIKDYQQPGVPTVEGLFLVFGSYGFYLPGPGEYDLWFEEAISHDIADDLQLHSGVDNMWQGKIASNRVKLILP